MHFFPIERGPDDFQRGLMADQIEAACDRAFGPVQIESARELGGGEYNSVYLVRMAGREPVILRVAPETGRLAPGREVASMRQEHAIQPYLAAIAPLLPRTLAIDFTHQLIDRDYLFQTYMPGERWLDVAGELTSEQEDALWRELARISRTISTIAGDAFGHPAPGKQFATWSATVLAWLERSARDGERVGVDAGDVWAVREVAAARAHLLDEITRPRLSPGDLWPFNILIDRRAQPPAFTAVLDNDGYFWGDPLASWTFHLLPRRASPRIQALFWEVYGRPDDTPGHRFRAAVYDALHQGNALAYVAERGPSEHLPSVRSALAHKVAELRAMI